MNHKAVLARLSGKTYDQMADMDLLRIKDQNQARREYLAGLDWIVGNNKKIRERVIRYCKAEGVKRRRG